MSEAYDYVIVGSGVAATLVCDRLLEADPLTSILVLEAGERIPARDRRSWWDLVLAKRTPYLFTYDDDKAGGESQESYSLGNVLWTFKESRVRAYGGSTMHWGGGPFASRRKTSSVGRARGVVLTGHLAM